MDLLVIGADGADPRLLQYYLSKGEMPSLAGLLKREDASDVCPMASRFDGNDVPHTGPAWTTVYTGLTAAQHGVTEDGWTEGTISLEPHFEHTVFAELMEHGYSVGSFTMAVTYPAQVANDDSWMVSGYPSTGLKDQLVAPAGFGSKLPSDYGAVQAKNLISPDSGPKLPEKWREAEQRKISEVLPRFVTGDEDVLFYGTQMTDTMGHRSLYQPRYLDGVARRLAGALENMVGITVHPPRLGTIARNRNMRMAYRTLDWIVGELTDSYDPEATLLLSDHGFALDGRDHAYLGASVAIGDVTRPEYITDVKSGILQAVGVGLETEPQVDRPDEELSASEDRDVKSQLDALGYR